MNLVIVESPTKAKTIGKFLGKEYEIRASMGHVMDLPKSTLGVALDHDFKPEYELLADKAKIIAELKSLAKGADSIILATDPDREGEAIASHVKDVLSSNAKGKMQKAKFQRVVFHEITKEAIEEAFKNSRALDTNLVDAQTARRVLDRLVGYKLSPILWRKVRRGLSAGRVQSVALRLIVEREREIEKFKKEQYWTISAFLTKDSKHVIANEVKQSQADGIATSRQGGTRNDKGIQFELIEIDGEKIELQSSFQLYDGEYKVTKTTIQNQQQAQIIIDALQKKSFVVADVTQKETNRSPQPPYTTSTLQQDASRRFGYSGKRTMTIAQKLYEEGCITYHRTDSVNLAESAIKAMRSYIAKTFGEKYMPSEPRLYKGKQKLAQEAHEAIRPTKMSSPPAVITQELGRDYGKLYDLIWKRAIASQMSNAITESTTIIADTRSSVIASPDGIGTKQSQSDGIATSRQGETRNDSTYRFKANGSVLLFDGFLKINPQALQDVQLPEVKVGELLHPENINQTPHESLPPPRYNDASLIKTLEEKGIGRPSTYAAIITTIESRRYIERLEARFAATAVGTAVTEFLVKNFADIDDIPFTAQMEDELDEVAHGKKQWVPVMKAFYTPFAAKLKEVEGAERVKIAVEATDQACEKCGEPLVIRTGKFGKFYSCSTFPTCDFSKPYVEETGQRCPKDSGKVIVRKTRRGRKFFGCSNYPNCDFAAWKLEDIKKTDNQTPTAQVSSEPTSKV